MGGYRSTSWGNCELNLKSEIQLGAQSPQPHLLFPVVELITSWFMGRVFFPVIQAHVYHKGLLAGARRVSKSGLTSLILQLPVEYKTKNYKLTSRGYSNLYIHYTT